MSIEEEWPATAAPWKVAEEPGKGGPMAFGPNDQEAI